MTAGNRPAPAGAAADRLLAGIDTEHREHDRRAVLAGALEVCSIDGSLIRVPDSDANRRACGSAGTADGSSPCPQLRELRCSQASTRAALAVATDPSGACAGPGRDKGEAEQVLLAKALQNSRPPCWRAAVGASAVCTWGAGRPTMTREHAACACRGRVTSA
jgi:hypothetical protein